MAEFKLVGGPFDGRTLFRDNSSDSSRMKDKVNFYAVVSSLTDEVALIENNSVYGYNTANNLRPLLEAIENYLGIQLDEFHHYKKTTDKYEYRGTERVFLYDPLVDYAPIV